jgi:hypothetical protein
MGDFGTGLEPIDDALDPAREERDEEDEDTQEKEDQDEA